LKLRVVGLGDSTTAGTPGFLSPLESSPGGKGDIQSQYSYWIMRHHPDWSVLNKGINGQRTDEILSRFYQDVVQEKPDFVIILGGVNDVYQGIPLDSIETNLRAMYEEAIMAGMRVVACTVLPYNTASQSESRTIRELNSWIETTTLELDLAFCDTNRAVADPNDRNRLLTSPEGLHPDVPGYRAMGEALTKTIEQCLQSLPNNRANQKSHNPTM
jgi:acyl-CoA thioesterase-1